MEVVAEVSIVTYQRADRESLPFPPSSALIHTHKTRLHLQEEVVVFSFEPIVLNGANFLNSQREFYTMHSSSDACSQGSILLVMVERGPQLTFSPWPMPGPGPLCGRKGQAPLHEGGGGVLPLHPLPSWRFLGEAQLLKSLWTPRGDHRRTILGRL